MRKYKGVSKSYLDRTDKLLPCSFFSFFLRLLIGSLSSSLRKNLHLPQAHPVSPYNSQRSYFSPFSKKKNIFFLSKSSSQLAEHASLSPQAIPTSICFQPTLRLAQSPPRKRKKRKKKNSMSPSSLFHKLSISL